MYCTVQVTWFQIFMILLYIELQFNKNSDEDKLAFLSQQHFAICMFLKEMNFINVFSFKWVKAFF